MNEIIPNLFLGNKDHAKEVIQQICLKGENSDFVVIRCTQNKYESDDEKNTITISRLSEFPAHYLFVNVANFIDQLQSLSLSTLNANLDFYKPRFIAFLKQSMRESPGNTRKNQLEHLITAIEQAKTADDILQSLIAAAVSIRQSCIPLIMPYKRSCLYNAIDVLMMNISNGELGLAQLAVETIKPKQP